MIEVLDRIDETRRWIAAIAPNEDERARLAGEYGVPTQVVAHALDEKERPRVALEDGVTLVVLRTPIRMPEGSDVPWSTTPMSLALTARDVVTIAPRETDMLARARATLRPRRALAPRTAC